MSKIGKKPIEIPENVKINFEDDLVIVKGPLGEIKLQIPPKIKVNLENNLIKVEPETINKLTKKLWGTIRSLINNAVIGVTKGFEKRLIIEGLGYQAQVSGNNLVLKVGYTHPVELKIPEDLKVKVEKNIISVWGIDKQKVGNFAAIIRKQKPPEPYHGKGIRYENEVIRKKVGKKA
jgi:large subunit ribosomal protein L6